MKNAADVGYFCGGDGVHILGSYSRLMFALIWELGVLKNDQILGLLNWAVMCYISTHTLMSTNPMINIHSDLQMFEHSSPIAVSIIVRCNCCII